MRPVAGRSRVPAAHAHQMQAGAGSPRIGLADVCVVRELVLAGSRHSGCLDSSVVACSGGRGGAGMPPDARVGDAPAVRTLEVKVRVVSRRRMLAGCKHR